MGFKPLSEIDSDEVISFLFCGYDAVDTDQHLALSTTNGRTRNARRWFITRYTLPSGRTDWKAGKVTFRAWTPKEAVELANTPRIQKRIAKVFAAKAVENA